MQVDVISLFPEMFNALTQYGVSGRAVENKLLTVVNLWNPRDYTDDNHRTVDDRPYGGGPGMVMMVEPLQKAIQAARKSAPIWRNVPPVDSPRFGTMGAIWSAIRPRMFPDS